MNDTALILIVAALPVAAGLVALAYANWTVRHESRR